MLKCKARLNVLSIKNSGKSIPDSTAIIFKPKKWRSNASPLQAWNVKTTYCTNICFLLSYTVYFRYHIGYFKWTFIHPMQDKTNSEYKHTRGLYLEFVSSYILSNCLHAGKEFVYPKLIYSSTPQEWLLLGLVSIWRRPELQKSCGHAGITCEEGLVVEHSVGTNVIRTMQSTSWLMPNAVMYSSKNDFCSVTLSVPPQTSCVLFLS